MPPRVQCYAVWVSTSKKFGHGERVVEALNHRTLLGTWIEKGRTRLVGWLATLDEVKEAEPMRPMKTAPKDRDIIGVWNAGGSNTEVVDIMSFNHYSGHWMVVRTGWDIEHESMVGWLCTVQEMICRFYCGPESTDPIGSRQP